MSIDIYIYVITGPTIRDYMMVFTHMSICETWLYVYTLIKKNQIFVYALYDL